MVLLQRLLKDEVQTRVRSNNVKQRRFSERLQAALFNDDNRSVEAAQMSEELIAVARDFRDETGKLGGPGAHPRRHRLR